MAKQSIEFEQVIERGCGLDVHRDTVVATVMGKGIQTETRTFGTTNKFIERIGRVAREFTSKRWSNGKYRDLLETCTSCASGISIKPACGQCKAYKKCTWQKNRQSG